MHFRSEPFHNYLLGCRFTLCTDNRPLISLFNEHNAILANALGRIQQWNLILVAYEYNIASRYTSQHGNADAMSRLPLYTSHGEMPVPGETELLMEHLNRPQHYKSGSGPGKTPWWQVLRLVQERWSEHAQETELQPFAFRRTGLSVQDGCLLWGNWVIIPFWADSRSCVSFIMGILGLPE